MTEGVIKHLFRERGFGFIKAEGSKDIFFHRRALRNIRFELLKEGDPVKFNIVKESKGPRGVNIEVKEEKE